MGLPARRVAESTLLRVPRVLVTRELPEGGLDPLLAAGFDVVQRGDYEPWAAADLRDAVADVDGIVCLLPDRIDAEVLRACSPRLKVVANVAVGPDNVDVATATELGI